MALLLIGRRIYTNLVLRLPGTININELQSRLNEIVKRHDSLRMRAAEIDGSPYFIYDDDFLPKIEEVDIPSTSFFSFGGKTREKLIRKTISEKIWNRLNLTMRI